MELNDLKGRYILSNKEILKARQDAIALGKDPNTAEAELRRKFELANSLKKVDKSEKDLADVSEAIAQELKTGQEANEAVKVPLDLAEIQKSSEEIFKYALLKTIAENDLINADRVRLEKFLEENKFLISKEQIVSLLIKIRKFKKGLESVEEVLEALKVTLQDLDSPL